MTHPVPEARLREALERLMATVREVVGPHEVSVDAYTELWDPMAQADAVLTELATTPPAEPAVEPPTNNLLANTKLVDDLRLAIHAAGLILVDMVSGKPIEDAEEVVVRYINRVVRRPAEPAVERRWEAGDIEPGAVLRDGSVRFRILSVGNADDAAHDAKMVAAALNRAATPAADGPEALDVERLALALRKDGPDNDWHRCVNPRGHAESIAAEYARLSQKEQPDE